MNETEWLSSSDPSAMLNRLLHHVTLPFAERGIPKPSERKLRLFACAVARRHVAQHDRELASRSIDVVERAVELEQYDHSYDDRPNRLVNQWWAVCRSREAAELMARHYPGAATAALLRCINGNPFAKMLVLNGGAPWEAIEIARAAYDERKPDGTLDPARLAVLSDCLEEFGTGSEELLAHLRSKGAHFRGCWAVDLILEKG